MIVLNFTSLPGGEKYQLISDNIPQLGSIVSLITNKDENGNHINSNHTPVMRPIITKSKVSVIDITYEEIRNDMGIYRLTTHVNIECIKL